MADVRAFFESYLPGKLEKNPSLASDIGAVYQFSLGDAGSWIVDLTNGNGSVKEGTADDAGCVVTATGADFGKLLDSPAQAMMLFTMGKLKVSNVALGMKLQKLLA